MQNEVNPATAAAEGIFGGDLGLVPKQEVAPVVEPQVTEPVNQPAQIQEPVVTEPSTELILEEEPVVVDEKFDENKYLQDTFGTTDKTVIKDRITKYEQIQKDYEEAALKLAQPKYNNKIAEVLDEILSKTGGDIATNKDFVKNTLDLLTTDEKTLDPLSLVKFNLRIQYPNMAPELLDAHIKQAYMQGEEFTDEQQNAGKAKLAMDAQVAQTALGELKAKALTNDTSKQVALQKLQEEKRQAAWTEPVKKVVEDFKAIKLNIGKVGGKNAYVNFEIKGDIAKGYEKVVYDSMIQQGGLPTDEGIGIAQQTLRALFIADNLDAITAHIASKLQSDSIKKEIESYHNPSTTGKTQRQEVSTQKSQDEVYAEAMGWKKQ